jgi:hypothetical protein
LGPPSDQVGTSYQEWLYRQYYSSFGQSRLNSYPWTALGYTFDWAPGPQHGFERFGESEFVIRKGAPIEVLRADDTVSYCRPR